MGLTIFYTGKIRDMALLPCMLEEVEDICNNLKWKCNPMHPYTEIPLAGFQFHPEGSEPVWMTFRKNGLLVDPVNYIFKGDTNAPPYPQAEFWLSCVTQFAGMNAHMALIKLLKYLSQKYFDDFELIDESDYWETGDTNICKYHFDAFEKAMDDMAMKLSKLDGRYDLAGDSVKRRLDELLRTRGFDDILRVLE